MRHVDACSAESSEALVTAAGYAEVSPAVIPVRPIVLYIGAKFGGNDLAKASVGFLSSAVAAVIAAPT